MSNMSKIRLEGRKRRHGRVRKKIHGTAARPRLAVFRSNRHLVMQVIDDDAGRHAGRCLDRRGRVKGAVSTSSIDGAERVGTLVAERAKAAGVSHVIFDRGGFLYHGRIAAAADAAREAGLEF